MVRVAVPPYALHDALHAPRACSRFAVSGFRRRVPVALELVRCRTCGARRDGWVRKPPPATMGDYLLGGTALKQAPEHPTSASITSIKEKVLTLNAQTAFPAFGKSGGGEKSAGKPAAASKVAPRLAKASKAFVVNYGVCFVVSTAFQLPSAVGRAHPHVARWESGCRRGVGAQGGETL